LQAFGSFGNRIRFDAQQLYYVQILRRVSHHVVDIRVMRVFARQERASL
jgi:hypothetical protein